MNETYQKLKDWLAFNYPGVYRGWISELRNDEHFKKMIKTATKSKFR